MVLIVNIAAPHSPKLSSAAGHPTPPPHLARQPHALEQSQFGWQRSPDASCSGLRAVPTVWRGRSAPDRAKSTRRRRFAIAIVVPCSPGTSGYAFDGTPNPEESTKLASLSLAFGPALL